MLVCDLFTKQLAIQSLRSNPWRRVTVIPGFMDFLWAENTGGAFSLFNRYPMLILVGSAIAVVIILLWSRKYGCNVTAAQISYGLIAGGAVGNLVDRVRFGYVVDFIHWYVRTGGREYAWPTFNVADCAIVVGIFIFMGLSLFTKLLDPVEASVSPEIPESREDASDHAEPALEAPK